MGHRASDFSSLGQLVLMPMGFIYRDLAVRGHSLFGELFRQAAVFPESQQRFIQQIPHLATIIGRGDNGHPDFTVQLAGFSSGIYVHNTRERL